MIDSIIFHYTTIVPTEKVLYKCKTRALIKLEFDLESQNFIKQSIDGSSFIDCSNLNKKVKYIGTVNNDNLELFASFDDSVQLYKHSSMENDISSDFKDYIHIDDEFNIHCYNSSNFCDLLYFTWCKNDNQIRDAVEDCPKDLFETDYNDIIINTQNEGLQYFRNMDVSLYNRKYSKYEQYCNEEINRFAKIIIWARISLINELNHLYHAVRKGKVIINTEPWLKTINENGDDANKIKSDVLNMINLIKTRYCVKNELLTQKIYPINVFSSDLYLLELHTCDC